MPRATTAAAALLGVSLLGLAPLAAPLHAAPEGTRRFVYAGAVGSLDPARIEGPWDERAVLACFEGLTVLDPATGEVRPGVAERWETSPDGKTWTFHLRDATWRKHAPEGPVEVAKVTAEDFVFAWKRLLDPQTASPHAHLLDALPGVIPLSTEHPRYEAFDRLVGDLDAAIGGKAKQTLSGAKVIDFLNDGERNARRWLGELNAPEAREFLAWKDKDPYQAARATKLMAVLSAERDRLIASVQDAEAHVGTDRGFWAKDAKTLVVQTEGPAPWLPSLLARGPLVPVHPRTVERRREAAFTAPENFVGNGAFLSLTEFPRTVVDDSGDRTQFKLVLAKNPSWRGAAEVLSDRLECLVNEKPDEILRRYALKEVAWVSDQGLPADAWKQVRAAKAPDAKADTPYARDAKAAAPDLYDTAAGSVLFLRFRCAPPLDKVEARRALAALVDREALAKSAGAGRTLPVVKRLVHPRTTGILADVAAPAWDAAKAKALYGARKFTGDTPWITILAPDEGRAADALAAAWKKADLPDEAAVTVQGTGPDLRAAVDGGAWDVCLTQWSPDFDDPLAFLLPWTTGSPVGDLRWSNAVYDALVRGARDVGAFAAAPDAAAKERPRVKAALPGATDEKGREALRRALLAEAESILLEEAVIVPLWLPVESGILSPRVRGMRIGGATMRPLLDVTPLTGLSVAD